MKIYLNPNLKVPELPNVMKFEKEKYEALRSLVKRCLDPNPDSRLTAPEV